MQLEELAQFTGGAEGAAQGDSVTVRSLVGFAQAPQVHLAVLRSASLRADRRIMSSMLLPPPVLMFYSTSSSFPSYPC